MLETVWYLLILCLQVLQTNPQINAERLQIEVYVASKPAYSFTVQGSAVAGQVMDAEKREVFGEYESTRRLPQAYVVFPRQALDPAVEAAGLAGLSSGDAGSDAAAKPAAGKAGAAGASSAKAEEKPKELVPVTIDFTKALKQLVPFRDKPRQSIQYPELSRFLSDGESKDSAAKDSKAAPSPSPAAKAGSAAKPASTPAASPAADQEAEKSTIELRMYSNRLVLSADFIQTIIFINFAP